MIVKTIRRGTIALNCDECGTPIMVFPYMTRENKNHFCSRSCLNEWNKKHPLRGELSPRWRGGPVEAECAQCGKPVYRKLANTKEHERHFCSKECDGKWRSENLRGEASGSWKESVNVKCDHCGKEFLRKPAKATRCNHNFCNRECKARWNSEHKCGDKSYQWRGGREALQERLKNDPKYRINGRMTAGISVSLKGNKKGQAWEKLAGYSCEQLMRRLNKTMPQGYSWDDFLSSELEIDHIIPKVAFNFITAKDADFRRCWDINNLQLLPATKNRQKSGRLEAPFQPSLLIQVAP